MSGRHYWLIVKQGTVAPEIFSMGLVEREHLPVFSFSEEAKVFLKLGDLEDEWETKEIGSGELLAILFGDPRGIGRVALDPLLEISDDGMMNGLVSIGRKKVIGNLLSLGCSLWVQGRDSEGRIMD